jgi:serine/threonine-protein kinase
MADSPTPDDDDGLLERLALRLGPSMTIERELGGGGMSRVFLAHDASLDRRIVIKVLHGTGGGGVSAERFRREMLVSAALQHPHIVPVLAAGDVDGVPWYSMPYIAGRSLRERLSSDAPVGVREAVRILRDVARACSFAHQQGVIHRDLKPENVLLTGDAAVIIDFGIAKALAAANTSTSERSAGLTQMGFTLGTPTYMAPEQYAADPDLDHRADIYAFGVTAFELLAGRPPFIGATSQELLRAHVSGPVPPLGPLRDEVPAELETLVRQCLAKDPAERPQDAGELVERLEALPVARATSGVRRAARMPSRRLVIGIVATVIASVAFIWSGLGRPRAEAAQPVASLAVLPFVQRGEDSLATWLAAGLGDDIAAQLLSGGGLQVASRLSVDQVSRTLSPALIAESLGVRTLLDGVVRRDGDELRVMAQLVDPGAGEVLWSGTFQELPISMGSIVDSIVTQVRVTMMPTAPQSRAGSRGNRDPSAYADFLRARTQVASRRSAEIVDAVRLLESVTARDSTFAGAWAALAEALLILPLYAGVPASQVVGPAEAAIARALRLEPDLPEALTMRAELHKSNWEWDAAVADFELALGRAPLAPAVQGLGEVHLVRGEFEKAWQAFERARALNPASPIPVALAGVAAALAGRLAASRAALHAAVAADSNAASALFLAGTAWLYLDEDAMAGDLLVRALTLAPTQPLLQGIHAQVLAREGDRTGAIRIRDRLLGDRGRSGVAGGLAHAHLAVGDTAAALTALERAVVEHDPIFGAEPLDSPLFNAIKGAPRFAAVRRQAGLLSGAGD